MYARLYFFIHIRVFFMFIKKTLELGFHGIYIYLKIMGRFGYFTSKNRDYLEYTNHVFKLTTKFLKL